MRNRERIHQLEGLIETMLTYQDQQIQAEDWHRVQRDINVLQESYRDQTGRYYTFRKPTWKR